MLSSKHCFSLHKDTTPPQPNHTVTPTHIEPEQYNTWNKSTISRKLLKTDVLTFETCRAVNSEIIKQVTSSWSILIQQILRFAETFHKWSYTLLMERHNPHISVLSFNWLSSFTDILWLHTCWNGIEIIWACIPTQYTLEGGWEFSVRPRSLFTPPGKTRYTFYTRLGGPEGRSEREEKSCPHRDSFPDRPARSQSLYRLSYTVHP